MAPREEPSFYLYSIGYSPKILTLGTLIYDNYGMPEARRATFPMRYGQAGSVGTCTNKSKFSDKQFEELEKQGEIISTPASGCFIYKKHAKYGLGLDFAELANLDFEYVKKCQKVVKAKMGRRVILNE
jgi:hypothetical protein